MPDSSFKNITEAFGNLIPVFPIRAMIKRISLILSELWPTTILQHRLRMVIGLLTPVLKIRK
jgi:cellobiose-specific phosphotransferase system component IIC